MKVHINNLKENERNPRSITEVKMELLIDSILTFPKMLELRPIVVDGSMTVLGGNMRTRALKRIAAMDISEVKARLDGHRDYEGKSETEKKDIVSHWTWWLDACQVEVVKANELSAEERHRFIIEDNASFGQWDYDMLANEWNSEDLNNWGVDVWNSEAEEETTESGVASEDDFDEEKDCIEVRCKKGDIWQLGEHRLMCGDSTSAEDFAKLMNGEHADISFTSPPYGVTDGSLREHKEADMKAKGLANHKAKNFYNTFDDTADVWPNLVEQTWQRMHENSDMQFINIQMLRDNKRELLKWSARHAEYFADLLIWDKGHSAPQMANNVVNNVFECIYVFGEKNATRVLKYGDFHGNINAILPISVGQNEYAKIHKAVFPVALPARILEINAKAKSVIDCFGGTGTTLIACEQLNRKCYMMELDPHYCDVIIARWEKLTGKTATRIETETE